MYAIRELNAILAEKDELARSFALADRLDDRLIELKLRGFFE